MSRLYMRWVFVVFVALSAAKAQANGFTSFKTVTKSVPAAEISGWAMQAKGKAKGTLFLCHGFQSSKRIFNSFDWIPQREGWNIVAFDFRGGESAGELFKLPTLGFFEIWDLKAAIDWAEANGLEKPYACYGISMGASVALRWAGMDDRIVGVLAQSPFKNGFEGAEQFQKAIPAVPQGPIEELVPAGLLAMWKQVDIPRAIAQRTDLLLWLTIGDRDIFPESDQRDILNASRSPRSIKRLIVRENSGHAGSWAWKENRQTTHDFLKACERMPSDRLRHVSNQLIEIKMTVKDAVKEAWSMHKQKLMSTAGTLKSKLKQTMSVDG